MDLNFYVHTKNAKTGKQPLHANSLFVRVIYTSVIYTKNTINWKLLIKVRQTDILEKCIQLTDFIRPNLSSLAIREFWRIWGII
jgi:hypothetical protein